MKARGERAPRRAGRALALLIPLAGALLAEGVPAANPPPPGLPALGAPPGVQAPGAPPALADGVAPAPAADRDHDGTLSILEWVDARFAELGAAAPPEPPAAVPPLPFPAPAATEEPQTPPE